MVEIDGIFVLYSTKITSHRLRVVKSYKMVFCLDNYIGKVGNREKNCKVVGWVHEADTRIVCSYGVTHDS